MSWPTGIDGIKDLLAAQNLQKVSPSLDGSTTALATAARHLDSAERLAEDDPDGAYALLYDAARKSLAAVLQAQGLRATSRGGHYAIQEAITAQFTKPPPRDAFRPFARLRRIRNQTSTTTSPPSPPTTSTPTSQPSEHSMPWRPNSCPSCLCSPTDRGLVAPSRVTQVGNNKRRSDRERRRRQYQSPPAHRQPPASAADQQLVGTLRAALRSADPLDLLAVVSGFLEVTDARSHDPFDRGQPHATLDELLESFVGTPFAETTAALTVMRALVADEFTAARIGRVLDSRTHPMPRWLTTLGDAQVEADVWLLTHVLGDGDDYLIGVTLPSGHALSALVYIDHNLGTVVKDAFVIPEPLEDVAIKVGRTMPDPDQSLTRTDPATARAVIDAAIEHGSRLYPPLESDTWPMCRPVIEWMLRLLPAGGVAPEPKEWTEAETQAIAEDFFAGSFGAPMDHADERSLLDSVLWFGTSYATGDPLRWSPVTVELLLADWVPRKIVAEPAFLAKLPDLLRAFIRHCHDRLGIRSTLTDETLAAVDHYEPDYQRVIRTARPQGPAALLAGLFDDAEDDRYALDSLDRRVGGRLTLQNLDNAPLPDEAFEWPGIPTDIHPVVEQYLEHCDRCADEILDVEHRTAMRRFLSRAAVADPAIFRRKASPVRGAAAIAWVICRANDTVGHYRSDLAVADLLAWFDITGSVSQRAEPLLRANGVDPHRLYGTMALRTPDLLTAAKRRDIITARDHWLQP